MIETMSERAERERAERADREARIRAYEKKMGVELPYSPVSASERPVESSETKQAVSGGSGKQKRPVESRAAYMKAFRKRPVVCPKCGHEFRELKRAKKKGK